MIAIARPFLRFPAARARRLLASAGICALAGCQLVDQRTFDPNAGPNAGRPPVAHVVPGPAPRVVPPFLVIQAGTPAGEWRPIVTHAAKVALSRKPGVLFLLTGMAPAAGPDAQAKALGALAAGDERAIAEAIIAAGAPPVQVQMQVRADPGGAARVQVDVR